MKPLFTLSIALAFGVGSLDAATLATDSPSNYAAWNNGDNGGSGFGAWDLTDNNNNGGPLFAGYYYETSSAKTNGAGAPALGMYGNPATAFALAKRAFTGGALTDGQSFVINLGVDFRNGKKGITLLAGAFAIYAFTVEADEYRSNGVNIGTWGFVGDSLVTLTATRAGNDLNLSLVRGLDTHNTSVTNGGAIDNFQLEIRNTDGGTDGNNDLYIGTMQVIPEPSAMAGISLASLLLMRRRRRG